MIAVIQRVRHASVEVKNKIVGEIQGGFLILLGIAQQDDDDDVEWLINKMVGLRVFSDENNKMNLSIKQINGDILLVSQFTLLASTKKGNRPSFTEAAKPEVAIPLYQKMIFGLSQKLNQQIQTGEFGADMQIQLLNDGPVTIILDSKNKK